MTQNEIPIFFSIDDNYAPFLSVALSSAIERCNPDRNYRAIVLYEKLNDKNIKKLSSLAADNFKIDFYPMRSGLESITDQMSNRLRCDYFTLTIYFRLFIPAMFPQYDKGIYIDSDIVVNDDLAKLFDVDIGDNYIGACPDISVVNIPEIILYMEEGVGVDRHKYINSGVLLMDLKKLREKRLDKCFIELLDKYHFDCIAPDQDYINAMCCGNIYYLDGAWNRMPDSSKPEDSTPSLVHYNLFSKPWCYDGIQYSELFWHYAERSDYAEEIRAYKNNYSDEQKDSDSKCFKLLIERGAKIAKDDVNFKNLFEAGVKIRL